MLHSSANRAITVSWMERGEVVWLTMSDASGPQLDAGLPRLTPRSRDRGCCCLLIELRQLVAAPVFTLGVPTLSRPPRGGQHAGRVSNAQNTCCGRVALLFC